MRTIKFMKIISAASISMFLLSGCMNNAKLQPFLNQHKKERIGFMPNIGNTAIMISKSSLWSELIRDGGGVYKQTIPQLEINTKINEIAKKTLKNKYPNLIIIPNEPKNQKYTISKFDFRRDEPDLNKDFVKKIINQYKLDRLIIINPKYMWNNDGQRISFAQQNYGVECGMGGLIHRTWGAKYFAAWEVLDIDAKTYLPDSTFFHSWYESIYYNQKEYVVGANSWGLPGDSTQMCSKLEAKKLSLEDLNNFNNWISKYYTGAIQKYISS